MGLAVVAGEAEALADLEVAALAAAAPEEAGKQILKPISDIPKNK